MKRKIKYSIQCEKKKKHTNTLFNDKLIGFTYTDKQRAKTVCHILSHCNKKSLSSGRIHCKHVPKAVYEWQYLHFNVLQ